MAQNDSVHEQFNRIVTRFENVWRAAVAEGQVPDLETHLRRLADDQRTALADALQRIDSEHRQKLTSGPGEPRKRAPLDTGAVTKPSWREGTVIAAGKSATPEPGNRPMEETVRNASAPTAAASGAGEALVRQGSAEPDLTAAYLNDARAADSNDSQQPDLSKVHVPGYEIKGELGRGGMGVVYLARQLGLNRLVALKMILAGGHASQDLLARFKAEGEAVARLEHPNIVHIYDVGEAGGFPYFSLEYVDGAPLTERISDQPQPPRSAAELVHKLARAMHYAHNRGIVHRDLKPDNVLVSKEDVPKIADFGLVKRTEQDSDSSTTRTGTVIGTPNYMAPEQARADKDIGPLADVYSLGALLYRLLTGRPPFVGANSMETVMQVLNDEPVSPTRLQPGIPRDLETICLKCLQKDQRQRYADAEALGDDLQRYLNDEPILARPVSLVERSWRWCRRKPAIAITSALAAACALALTIGGPTAALLINEQRKAAVDAKELAESNEELAEKNAQLAIQQRERAEQNAKVAKQQGALAVDAFQQLTNSVRKLEDTPATHAIKQELLTTALEGLQNLTLVSQDDAQRADLTMAAVHQRKGQILISLGRPTDARKEYEKVYRIIEAATADKLTKVSSLRNRVVALNKLGDVSRLEGDRLAAQQYYARGLTLMEAWARAAPTDERCLSHLATSYSKLGAVTDPEQAHDYLLRALKIREQLADNAPDELRFARLRDVRIIHDRLATVSFQQERHEAAVQQYERCLDLAKQLLQLAPDSFNAQQDLAVSYLNLGKSKRQLGRFEDAAADFAQALQLYRSFVETDPDNLQLQTEYALALARVGDHRKASIQAEKLRILAPTNFRNLYNIACCFGLCALAVTNEQSEDAGSPAETSENYVNKAVIALQAAVQNGLADLEFVRQDPDLNAIRSHPGYQKLLASTTGEE